MRSCRTLFSLAPHGNDWVTGWLLTHRLLDWSPSRHAAERGVRRFQNVMVCEAVAYIWVGLDLGLIVVVLRYSCHLVQVTAERLYRSFANSCNIDTMARALRLAGCIEVAARPGEALPLKGILVAGMHGAIIVQVASLGRNASVELLAQRMQRCTV